LKFSFINGISIARSQSAFRNETPMLPVPSNCLPHGHPVSTGNYYKSLEWVDDASRLWDYSWPLGHLGPSSMGPARIGSGQVLR